MVNCRYSDNLSGMSPQMQSYYQEYFEHLKAHNQLFSQTGSFYSIFAYMAWDGQKFHIVSATGEEIFNEARQAGVKIPDDYQDSVTDNVRAVFKDLCKANSKFTEGSLFDIPYENQELLNFAAISMNVKYGDFGFAGRGIYKDALYSAREATYWTLIKNLKSEGWWRTGESLEKATVRVACYLDLVIYSNKMNDIKEILLSQMWNAIKKGYPADDWIIGSYLADPAMPRFIEEHPDFTYDKLSFMALKNRDAYEAKYGRIGDNFRLSDEFANSFIGLGREF